MVVAVCGITFAFQTNTYAKKNFKVTPSKVEKQSKKSFRTITTKIYKTLSWIKCIFRQEWKKQVGEPLQ